MGCMILTENLQFANWEICGEHSEFLPQVALRLDRIRTLDPSNHTLCNWNY